MKRSVLWLATVILMGTVHLAWASEPGPERNAVVEINDIVVTATKTEETRQDVANSVILMNKAEIEESSASSLGDLLGNEAGIDWRTYGDYGGAAQTIKIRGMDSDGTQLRVNGLNVNSPSLGTADFGTIPLNRIERIEVVKGPGSLLYGTGAMGGTVSVETKRPTRDRMDLRADFGVGNNNMYQLSAEHGMFAIGDFGYYLTANQSETDGFRDNADLLQKDASVKLVLDKGELIDVSLYGDYMDRDYGMPGVQPTPETQDYFFGGLKYYNGESASLLNRGGEENYNAVLEIKSRPLEKVGVNLKGFFSKLENYSYNRYPWNGTGKEGWVRNGVLGSEGNLELNPVQGLTLLAGFDYYDFDYENEQYDLTAAGEKNVSSHTNVEADVYTHGVYAEAQYRPFRYIKGFLGVRQEDHSFFGHENVYRYGLVVNPMENTTLKFNRGSHFKAPTSNDLFWPEDAFTRGNPMLRPETGWHTDVTVEQLLFENRLFLTASYFHWDITDKIDWAPNPNFPGLFGPKYTPSNTDSYEADGFEAGAKIGPFYDTLLSFSYTYLDAKEQKGSGPKRDARYAPTNTFKGKLTYLSDFGLTASTTLRYVDERAGYYDTDQALTPSYVLDDYWTLDAKLEQMFCGHWRVSLQANNLFDKGYGTYVNTFTDQTTFVTEKAEFPGAGRSVLLNITFIF